MTTDSGLSRASKEESDERFADQAQHKAKPDPLWNKAKQTKQSKCFKPDDFKLAEDHSHCICPTGKHLYSNGSNCTILISTGVIPAGSVVTALVRDPNTPTETTSQIQVAIDRSP